MTADAVIVGAGPAGAAAALALAEAGVPVTLFDDNAAAGGQVFRTNPAGLPWRGPGADERGAELRARLAAATLVDHRPGHEVVGIHPGLALWVRGAGGQVAEVRPRAVLVAGGAVEVAVPVPGWQRPGVFGLGGLQLLLKGARTVPDGPVVLAGAGPLLYLLAAQFAAAGVPVAAVVDAAPRPGPGIVAGMATAPGLLARGIGFRARLARAGVRVMTGHMVVAVEGDADGIAAVEVAPVDADWRPVEGARARIAARVLGMGFGVRPNIELTRLAGADHAWDAALGGWYPVRDAQLETTVPGLYAAGDGAGVLGVDNALAEGRIAAAAIAGRLGAGDHALLGWRADAARSRRGRQALFRQALAEWSALRPGAFAAATAGTIVCRCEDVTAGELRAAVAAGYREMGPLKMCTRAGMGLCQGRVCTTAVQHILADEAGIEAGLVTPPTSRVPLRPVPLAALVNLPPSTV